MKKTKWILLNKKGDVSELRRKYRISEPMARILVNRNIKDIDTFLKSDGSLRDGRQMKDLQKAADILRQKISEGKSIRIFGDMDVDGITSTTILMKTIRRLGGVVSYDIPHRVTDGYGANVRMVEEAYHDGIDTIVTVDNGIAAFDAVDRAKELGMTVIVTDHHEVPYDELEDGAHVYHLPDADAVVDPKQEDCSYPFPGICGAMVAYKIAEVLLGYGFSDERMDELTELAALGTVCDVMVLEDENRTLVKKGIELMKHSSYLGIQKLLEINSIDPDKLSTYHLGFILGPSLNSTGRLDTAKRGVALLLENNEEFALQMAEETKHLNDERKNMTAIALEDADVYLQDYINDKIYLVYLPKCHESIAGIVAGKIKEKYGHPTIVLTDAEDGGLKGSGRSIDGYNIFAELTRQKHLLGRFGGHPMAAGVSLPVNNLEPLRRALNETCTLPEEAFHPKLYLDLFLPIDHITEVFVNELSMLEPYGNGNPKPVIADKCLSIRSAKVIGSNQNSLKFVLHSDNGSNMDALLFNFKDTFDMDVIEKYGAEALNQMYSGQANPIRLLITYTPSVNVWNDRKMLQVTIHEYDFV